MPNSESTHKEYLPMADNPPVLYHDGKGNPMANNHPNMNYRRRGTSGTLKLRGIVDIFEAGVLHTTALSALHDEKATTVRVDLTEVERLDVSALQILLALKQSIEASGRTFSAETSSEAVLKQFHRIGVTL
jgi:anti-anti-sigma regulatory factor